MATTTPKHKVRIETEIEKNREDGNWSRCLELSTQLPPEQRALMEFLMGEAKLEMFLQCGKEGASSALLAEAKKNLRNCLKWVERDREPLTMDVNLLLAKAYFVSGDFSLSLNSIQDSGIEAVTQVEKNLPLRIMKLVAESYAVKGMCLEKEFPDEESKEDVKTTCLTKATDLSLRYLQNMERTNGPYVTYTLGNILETAIQKGPMILIQNHKVDRAIVQYRSFMNGVENQSSLNLRQVMSRQFAETLLRGISRSIWPRFDTCLTTLTGPWKPHRYFGQSLFVPREREEEIILLLLISESLASQNVVLDRNVEFNESRNQSLQTVMAVYDLMTLSFTPLRHWYLDCFERAMKFSFQVKHIWFQFALSLLESNKSPVRALRILEEVAVIDPADPLPCLLGAKLCIEQLDLPHSALRLGKEAFNRCLPCDILYPRVCLLIGISNCVIFESGSDAMRRGKEEYVREGIEYLRMSLSANPSDHLPYFHLSLLMGHQRAIHDALDYAQAALLLNPQHLPTIQLLLLSLTALKQNREAYDLCEAALQEFPDQLILLYTKCHLEEELFENGRELALVTSKHLLKCWKNANEELPNRQGTRMIPGTNCDNQSIRMEQTMSEVTSMDSESWHRVPPRDGSLISNLSDSTCKNLRNIHLHIWLMIVELYIKLEQVSQAESCILEGVTTIFGPLSHQLMFVRGILAKSKKNLLEAKIYLQNSISINPKHARALQQLGHVYHLLGNQMSADKYLRDSLKVDSTLFLTWSYMGLVLEAMGDHDRANDCQMMAIKLEATSPILPFTIIPRSILE